MYAIVRRLFWVPYEWRRLATAVFLAAALIAIGETLVPHDGADGLALTLALCAAYPAGLWAARFLSDEERERLGALFDAGAQRRSGARDRTSARPRPRRPWSRRRGTWTGAFSGLASAAHRRHLARERPDIPAARLSGALAVLPLLARRSLLAVPRRSDLLEAHREVEALRHVGRRRRGRRRGPRGGARRRSLPCTAALPRPRPRARVRVATSSSAAMSPRRNIEASESGLPSS